MNHQQVCQQAIEVIKGASDFIRSQYEVFESSKVEVKSLNSLVSYVDVESEKMLVKGLSEIIKGSGFLTEEATTQHSQQEYTWIIDPLDGTTNFIHQIPAFSISVALYHRDKAVVGIVKDIMHNECFYAYEGGGAFMNEQPIRVSRRNDLGNSLIATGFPYEKFDYSEHYLNIIKTLMPRCRGIRRLGSAAIDLAYTACGRFDAFFEYNLNAWDVAAGAYIVEQAGGIVSDFSGETGYIKNRQILASNPYLHLTLLRLIQSPEKLR